MSCIASESKWVTFFPVIDPKIYYQIAGENIKFLFIDILK